MLRLCVLGNSHAAALKQAWDALSDSYPGIRLTFFASRGSTLSELKLSGDRLVPASQLLASRLTFTSGGSGYVHLARFDAFLVYGLMVNIPRPDQRLSRAVKRQVLTDVFDKSLGAHICRLIRKRSNAPIYVGHRPQHAAATGPESRDLVQYHEVYALMRDVLQSQGLELLPQPPETLVNGWDTKLELSRGSTALDVGDARLNTLHPDADVSHMNADFGRIYLEHALATMLDKQAVGGVAGGHFAVLLRRAAFLAARIRERFHRLPARVAAAAGHRRPPQRVAGEAASGRMPRDKRAPHEASRSACKDSPLNDHDEA